VAPSLSRVGRDEGLISALWRHLRTHRLSHNVCHHHVCRGCPPRRCPRQRRPSVRVHSEARWRRHRFVSAGAPQSPTGIARLASVKFSANGTAVARRLDRDRAMVFERRVRDRRGACRNPDKTPVIAALEARAIETRRSPVAVPRVVRINRQERLYPLLHKGSQPRGVPPCV